MPKISAPERREGGYTVIELMIVVMLMLIVSGAIVALMENVQKTEAFSADRAESLDKLRLGMQRVTRDIRQAESIDPSSTVSRLDMWTYVAGTRQRVVYDVSGTALTRTIGAQTAVVVQEGLASSAIFVYAPVLPNTQVVTVTMEIRPARTPDTTIVHTSEVKLRNYGKGQA